MCYVYLTFHHTAVIVIHVLISVGTSVGVIVSHHSPLERSIMYIVTVAEPSHNIVTEYRVCFGESRTLCYALTY